MKIYKVTQLLFSIINRFTDITTKPKDFVIIFNIESKVSNNWDTEKNINNR